MRRGLVRDHAGALSVAVRIMDVASVAVCGVAAYWGRFPSELPRIPAPDYSALILFAVLGVVVVFPAVGIYRSWRGRSLWRLTGTLLSGWAAVLVLVVVSFWALKLSAHYSRLWLGVWSIASMLCLVGIRFCLFTLLRIARRRGWNQRQVAIFGAGALGRQMLTLSREADWAGYEVIAFFDDDGELIDTDLDGVRVMDPSGIVPFVQGNRIDEVWIALPLRAELRVKDLLHQLRHCLVDIRFVPDIFGFRLLNHAMSEIAGMPVLDLTASPMVGINRALKSLEDRLLAAVILLFISPLLAVLAVGVKISSRGPVFYKQERVGWNGRSFLMLKFRSMPVDAESGTGAVWASKGENRATPFGAFLRRTSLDELPQFINVLKGEMSIVGPRPERPVFVERFKDEIPDYMQKHLVKAGITGWAQVNGWRGNTDLRKRIEHDLYYIENWSLAFDLKIIFLTLFKGFVHRNAY